MPRYIEELVSKQVHRSELARQKELENGEKCLNPTITISRGMGSGARVVAEKLAHDIGWSLWDKELVEAVAKDASVSQRVVELFDEKTRSEIDLMTRAALGDNEMGGFLYATHLAKAVASIAKLGNAIILGRGANLLLPKALHVRIDASDEYRIRNMMQFETMTHAAAEAKIRESDKERHHFMVSLFGKERVEHAQYDLIIWMDKFENDTVTNIIKAALPGICKRE